MGRAWRKHFRLNFITALKNTREKLKKDEHSLGNLRGKKKRKRRKTLLKRQWKELADRSCRAGETQRSSRNKPRPKKVAQHTERHKNTPDNRLLGSMEEQPAPDLVRQTPQQVKEPPGPM